MSKHALTVRQEKPPKRCDICHQSDLFDSDTQNCSRCSVYKPVLPITTSPPRHSPQEVQSYFKRLNQHFAKNKRAVDEAERGQHIVQSTSIIIFIFNLLSFTILISQANVASPKPLTFQSFIGPIGFTIGEMFIAQIVKPYNSEIHKGVWQGIFLTYHFLVLLFVIGLLVKWFGPLILLLLAGLFFIGCFFKWVKDNT